MKVKELPIDDRPREKLALRGVQSLSDAELLAILLRTGVKGLSVIQLAQGLITRYCSLGLLSCQTFARLKKIHGIGQDKAAALIAAFELSRRVDSQKKWFSNKVIRTPEDMAEIFIPLLRDEVKEKFYVVSLNAMNKIIRYDLIFVGSLTGSIVHAREIFKAAIDCNAASILLIHNHPSGNLQPSNEDISMTVDMMKAGKIIEIRVIDHIIVAGDGYTSLVEQKLI